ncbi:uncharacterized protein LACBIDRAFT_304479 [Laccaria bicolor S238N-H82]|uniref:Predicted protein n=1 Tax=Laccaria bicolor (strain S238N-H82 / ATCC MYA-4686) TaxID=486041 RepID=B0DLQ1_LACBS|nr:uncharacterized protein LACBIDRAFT_304479 [Laccaria bicolor S238N-H82]EDR04430.1 predicted protein [Laccaria bicolor S238N-H82]|eukprot:XP_001884949.1 predicted protein [Laccaria bicolor S238N-H82]
MSGRVRAVRKQRFNVQRSMSIPYSRLHKSLNTSIFFASSRANFPVAKQMIDRVDNVEIMRALLHSSPFARSLSSIIESQTPT